MGVPWSLSPLQVWCRHALLQMRPKFRLLTKRKGQNLYVGEPACLHCVGIYGNKYYILNMDSNIYLERQSPFHYIKKKTRICLNSILIVHY